METILIVISLALAVAGVFILRQYLAIKKKHNELYEKYKDIIDLDAYKQKIIDETTKIKEESIRTLSEINEKIESLRTDYANKHKYWENLQNEISLFEEQLEIMSYGLYKPHFDFETSEIYKTELENVREKCKNMIQSEEAAICSQTWTVNGSAAEGKKQTKRYIKLMLRAFNGECEALLADVRWNNIVKMEERLQKSYEAINKLGETHTTEITEKYKKLKLNELRLAYEYQDKIRKEKEEQKRIQDQIREEERAQKEIERALKEAEDDEGRFNKALEQARKEMEKAHGDAVDKLKEKMDQLQKALEEAEAKHQRALSMAQQTKAGHVYIISNIGSFGDQVYKIGMTRRLEPMDRVKELGDASVPFEFDVHAMIYSENAPELESLLHSEFDSKRLNLVNERKEFFRVNLDQIEQLVKQKRNDVEFVKTAEARDFRESLAIRESWKKKKEDEKNIQKESIPESI